jgi:D-alanyl-D-alanine-carboxypeptidase/D-alanyl-D-alanine-endopeptidase
MSLRLTVAILGLVALMAPLSGPAHGGPSLIGAPATVGDVQIARLIRYRAARQHRGTGIVVGVLRRSGGSIIAFGETARGNTRKADGGTIFEIASLTKVFTALLLADAATRDEVGLDDPLLAYVPSGVGVPQFAGRVITLTDLATHTAGLPLRPNNLHAAPDADNKYAGYTLGQLYAGLPDYQLDRAPGTRFEYSNVDFALLGHGLGLRQGQSYAALLGERITGPLGLSDTALVVSPSARGRQAQGYDVDLKPVGASDEGALAPGGGLHSTANDLLRLLALFLDGSGPGELPRAARLMLTVDRPGDDSQTRMALGWPRSVTHGETYYWANGSGDGSRTFMGFNPSRHIAVVALANAGGGAGVDDIGRHVLDPAWDVDMRIPAIHHQIVLPEAALERLLGLYRYGPGDDFAITRGVKSLLIGSGPSQLPIYPEAPTRFFAKAADIQLEFAAGSSPPPTLVLHQDGKSFIYKRVP